MEAIERKIDQTVPRGKWEFDSEVTDAFDDMLERSIPQYQTMRNLCFDLGRRFVQANTSIVDLGCSRGESMVPYVDKFGAFNHHVGVEISEPMLTAARERFQGMINAGVVEVRKMDLRSEYPPVKASLVSAILTLQFVPIEHRQRIILRVWKSLVEGGAFVMVEKVLGASAEIDEKLTEVYLDLKRANGYTEDQILRKRLALEGILVPVTARWNEELLRGAGFSSVDCFWRWSNFAGWLAIK